MASIFDFSHRSHRIAYRSSLLHNLLRTDAITHFDNCQRSDLVYLLRIGQDSAIFRTFDCRGWRVASHQGEDLSPHKRVAPSVALFHKISAFTYMIIKRNNRYFIAIWVYRSFSVCNLTYMLLQLALDFDYSLNLSCRTCLCSSIVSEK